MMKDIMIPDFAKAITEENFKDMSDIYETMINGENPDPFAKRFGFTKLGENGTLYIPDEVRPYIKKIGSRFIYALGKEDIKFSAQDKDFDDKYKKLVFEFFEDESIETKYIDVDDKIVLDELTLETLELSVNDIVLFTIFEDSFEVEKFTHPIMRKLGKWN